MNNGLRNSKSHWKRKTATPILPADNMHVNKTQVRQFPLS